jgi:arylformamidase
MPWKRSSPASADREEDVMGFKKIIDLSHPLRPGREARQLKIEEIPATDITGAPSEQERYIMHRVEMDNHIGTHMEVPYHVFEDGADLARTPLEQLAGEAVILDLRGHSAGEGIPPEEVQHAAEQAGGVGQGDIAFCMTGWSQYYGGEQYDEPPFLTREAVRWLVSRGIKMLGIDTRGSMDPAFPDRQNHLPLFEAGIVYVENLAHLEAVPESRVTVVALPPAIEGLEGFPVRVVALL